MKLCVQFIALTCFQLLSVVAVYATASAEETSPAYPDSSGNDAVALAAEYCISGRTTEAVAEIDAAMHTSAARRAYTWYVKGFIYKELYKSSLDKQVREDARNNSVSAFLHSRTLDDYNPQVFNVDLPLKYIIGTYFSDALYEAAAADQRSVVRCDILMEKFLTCSELVDTDVDLSIRKSEYSKTLAMRFFNLWQENTADDMLYKEALMRMTDALVNNPADCSADYNLAVFHFRRSEVAGTAGKVCEADSELDKALSEMLKAEQSCAQNMEILRGILNIYRLRQNHTMVAEYERRIAALEQKPMFKN